MAIPNGMISYSPDMTAPYSVDTVATYTCNDGGFRFMAGVGDQMRTCTEVVESESTVVSGATFGGMAPSCEPVREFNCTHQHTRYHKAQYNEVASFIHCLLSENLM